MALMTRTSACALDAACVASPEKESSNGCAPLRGVTPVSRRATPRASVVAVASWPPNRKRISRPSRGWPEPSVSSAPTGTSTPQKASRAESETSRVGMVPEVQVSSLASARTCAEVDPLGASTIPGAVCSTQPTITAASRKTAPRVPNVCTMYPPRYWRGPLAGRCCESRRPWTPSYRIFRGRHCGGDGHSLLLQRLNVSSPQPGGTGVDPAVAGLGHRWLLVLLEVEAGGTAVEGNVSTLSAPASTGSARGWWLEASGHGSSISRSAGQGGRC